MMRVVLILLLHFLGLKPRLAARRRCVACRETVFHGLIDLRFALIGVRMLLGVLLRHGVLLDLNDPDPTIRVKVTQQAACLALPRESSRGTAPSPAPCAAIQ